MTPVEKKLNEWKRQLLDLSRRNRLLHFRETKRLTLKVAAPSPSALFRRLVEQEKPLTVVGLQTRSLLMEQAPGEEEHREGLDAGAKRLRDGELLFDAASARVANALYTLNAKGKTELEERGVNVLFLAFGFLHWREADQSEQEVRSPLLLLPVTLERECASSPYTIAPSDDEVTVNPTLAKVLEEQFGLSLPHPDFDTSDALESFFGLVRRAVAGRSGWSVEEDCYLSVFSFMKLSMYRDLEGGVDIASAHPILAALAGNLRLLARSDRDTAEIPADELDDRVQAQNCLQVLDADSSQQAAIELAKNGVSFVLQGPPGTGKSQTIANIIAELLGAGRTVLFVSEKAAALDVVHRRLREVGLADFCLALHSFKANKREVVGELARVYRKGNVPGSAGAFDYSQLERRRAQLNDYVQEMHTRREPLGLSAYQLQSELLTLQDVPDVALTIRQFADKGLADLVGIEDALAALSASAETIVSLANFPWVGFNRDGRAFETRRMVEAELCAVDQLLEATSGAGAELAEDLAVSSPTTVAVASWLADVGCAISSGPPIVAHWLQPEVAEQALTLLAELQAQTRAEREEADRLSTEVDESFLEVDIEALAARLAGVKPRKLKLLDSTYRADLQLIRSKTRQRRRVSYTDAVRLVESARTVLARRMWLSSQQSNADQLLGSMYHGTDTNWGETIASIEWAIGLRQAFGGSAPAALVSRYSEIVSMRTSIGERAQGLRRLVEELSESLRALEAGFEALPEPWPRPAENLVARTFDEVGFFVRALLSDLDGMERWNRLHESAQECAAAGCDDAVWRLTEANVRAEEYALAGRKRFLMLWHDQLFTSVPALKRFDATKHGRAIEEFRKLDRAQLEAARRRLAQSVASRRPALSAAAARVDSSEPTRLMKEAKKKRRVLPLRKLFAAIPHLLPTLKPCMMMSPLSVSYFLELGSISFDCVIFDEASQVRPEDAVGAIMRGSQTIVVGDTKQLPPTSFFDVSTLGDDWADDIEESDEAAFESILDLCDTLQPYAPSRMLQWHYRSRHEGLIAFSNRFVYDGNLITFPSSEFDGASTGVHFEYVENGVYDRGGSKTNRREVEEVVRLVGDHIASQPDVSLGVVAFSEAQMAAVDQALWRYRAEHPEVEFFFNNGGSEPFFVKNLENVQGDERDTIIFSIGYGRDSLGRLAMNFGPLNRQGGERRLNVAVTRARSKVVVVSSIRGSDLDMSRSSAEGVRLLKHYLEYAERGSGALEAASDYDAEAEFGSPFEEDVATVLEKLGFMVHRQVGCSGYRIDLGVVHPEFPGAYAVGIECDGATYHSAATARERDRLREEVLCSLGWRLHRIWSTDWFRNRSREIERLREAVDKAISAGRPTLTPVRQVEPREVEPRVPAEPDEQEFRVPEKVYYPGFGAYVPAPVRRRSGDLFASGHQVKNVILEAVRAEGPVHEDLVARHVALTWGYGRTGSRIREVVGRVAAAAVHEGLVVKRGAFYWPFEMASPSVRVNRPDRPSRSISEICIEELSAALLVVLGTHLALTASDLVQCTARAFGFERTGKDVKAAIEEALELLTASGSIQVDGDGMCLVAKGA